MLNSFNLNNNVSWHNLLTRVDIIPTSLTLAQAANESAWGQSRFARQGNNYFGIICHRPGCGIVPKRRIPGARFEVTRYPSTQHSVANYLHTLNTNPSYKFLRSLRKQQRQDKSPISSITLARGLFPYSELGHAYVIAIQSLIRYKKLQKFDNE